jgi:hypothetical protein
VSETQPEQFIPSASLDLTDERLAEVLAQTGEILTERNLASERMSPAEQRDVASLIACLAIEVARRRREDRARGRPVTAPGRRETYGEFVGEVVVDSVGCERPEVHPVGYVATGASGPSGPAPVTPDPVPREPTAPRITVADVMRDAFDAMDAQRLPTPEQAAIHAAERAFLAAYREERDNARTSLRRRLAGMPDTLEDQYKAARDALDAADLAAKVEP